MTAESDAQDAVRLAARRAGAVLWRNNVGAGKLSNGSFIRWGLANESMLMNRGVKSGDLIGIEPVLITPAHVGLTIGRFVSAEVKAPGWRYHGTSREMAQKAWVDLVISLGGKAVFTTGEWE